jgi:DNA-binding NtrC family response regulator
MKTESKIHKSNIVLVSTRDADCSSLCSALRDSGYPVERVYNVESTGRALPVADDPDLIIWQPPRGAAATGTDLKRLKTSFPSTELLVLADWDDSDYALKEQDMCIASPTADTTHLLSAVNRAVRYGRLKRELENLRSQVAMSFGFDNLTGVSEPVMALRETIARVSPTDITIAISGPGGTGKRLIAKTIHHHSNRRFAPLINLDCAALSEATLETELFGAKSDQRNPATAVKSALERADGGTLLINEINFMPRPLQLRLAEFLKDYRLPQDRTGSVEKIDLRLLVTAAEDLETLVSKGALQTELCQYLNVYPIRVPALCERTEDIEGLVDYFLRRIAARLNRGPLAITHQALERLYSHSWPGNVRELENSLQRAAGLCRDDQIDAADIRFVSISGTDSETAEPLRKTTLKSPQGLLADSQKTVIARALEENDWNFTQTAQELGIGRTTLWRKVKKYNLARETVDG